MKSYDTLAETLASLKARGYRLDFNLRRECLETGRLDPAEFQITEVHRFEGMTDPADSAVAYAIESKHGAKGVLVDAYGAYSDPHSAAMVEKLRVAR